MANTVYNVLRGVNAARRNMVDIIKNKNIDITDDANFSTISTILDTLPENTGEIPGTWPRPSYWPDTETILNECEDLIIGTATYKPFALVLYKTDCNKFIRPYFRTNGATVLQYKLSDGQVIAGSSSTSVEEFDWDTTKDIEIDGHKFRYCILYMNNGQFSDNGVSQCYGTSDTYTATKNDVLEVIDRDNYTATGSSNGFTIAITDNLRSVIIHHTRTAIASTGNQNKIIDSYINYATGSINTNYTNFRYFVAPYKTSVSLNNITQPGYIRAINMAASTFNFNYFIEGRTFEYFASNQESYTNLNVTGLKYFKPNPNGISVSSLYDFRPGSFYASEYNIIYLGSMKCNCIKPKVDLMGVIRCTGTKLFALDTSSYSGTRELVLPNDIKISNPSTFLNINGLEILTLEEGFKVSGLVLSTSFFSKEALLDIIDKLADVTEEESTYTFTFGSANLEKLTAAEIQVATDKGWTIS